jgi:hypothetical protein
VGPRVKPEDDEGGQSQGTLQPAPAPTNFGNTPTFHRQWKIELIEAMNPKGRDLYSELW